MHALLCRIPHGGAIAYPSVDTRMEDRLLKLNNWWLYKMSPRSCLVMRHIKCLRMKFQLHLQSIRHFAAIICACRCQHLSMRCRRLARTWWPKRFTNSLAMHFKEKSVFICNRLVQTCRRKCNDTSSEHRVIIAQAIGLLKHFQMIALPIFDNMYWTSGHHGLRSTKAPCLARTRPPSRLTRR